MPMGGVAQWLVLALQLDTKDTNEPLSPDPCLDLATKGDFLL